MSRLFDGVDDRIEAPIQSLDVGDWTMGCWAYPISAGGGGLFVGAVDVPTLLGQALYFNSSGRDLNAFQSYGTTNALTQTNLNALSSFSAWFAVLATFTVSSRLLRIFVGSLASPVAEATYAVQTAGVGARITGTRPAEVGGLSGSVLQFDGRIARAFIDERRWTLDEMEEFRLGHPPVALAVADV